ncbi:hypothetical protein [Lutimonas sp.]|uniref:hypothetical protein n=1 Tax=Lutimonas sp. TaxID=1872403 RepID=UPI003C760886
MKINKLDRIPGIEENERLVKAFNQLDKVLTELREKQVPDEVISSINNAVDETNNFKGSEKELKKQIRKAQSGIIKLIEKKLKMVPKNHYRNLWLVLGMSAFGLPIGVALGASQGNNGMLGAGLPIGMVIGIAVGTGLDRKAFKEGRQLDLEIKRY